MKKILCLLVAIIMLLSVVACSSSESEEGTTKEETKKNDSPAYTMLGQYAKESDKSGDFIDPSEIYNKVTYTPEMFYGDYRLLGGDDAELDHNDKVGLIDYETDYAQQISALPTRIKAGKNTLAHVITNIQGYNWMEVYFRTENNNLTYMKFAYTVEGNTLTLTALEEYEYDNTTNHISYRLSEDKILKYQFEFKGMELVLSNGDKSVTLSTCLDAYGTERYIYTECCLANGSPRLGDIDVINLRWSAEDDTRFYIGLENDEDVYNGVLEMTENGAATITLPLESGTKVYNLAYFYGNYDGLVLSDGTNTYYYTDTESNRKTGGLNGSISYDEIAKLENMTEDKVDEIVTKRNNLFDELASAFDAANLNVRVDKNTGEIALDSAVLFGFNESEVSDEGKTFLDSFIGIYTDVVFSEEYDGFVSKIIVEGHTDTNGDYDMNLALSKERADGVLGYCNSMGIAAFDAIASSVGCSYDNPVFDDAGNVDMDASRRVSFKFVINLG